MKSFFQYFTFINYLQFLVLLIPVLMITGSFLPDLFLSLSALSFLIYLFVNKKLDYLNHKFFYFFLIFFLILLIGSIFSDYKNESLIKSLGYIRFGIFLFVVKYLIDKKIDFIKNLGFVLISIFIVLFLDAVIQKIIGNNILGMKPPFGRITSFFGQDIKLGGYIARIVPLLIAILFYLKFSQKFIFIIFFISFSITILSGERTSIFMMILITIGYFFLIKISHKKKLLALSVSIIMIFIAIQNEEIKYRIIDNTYNQINFSQKKPFFKNANIDGTQVILHRDSTIFPRIYHMYFETSLKIFKDNKFIGSGPGTYKFKSKEDKYLSTSDHEGWVNFVKKFNEEKMIELKKIHEKKISKILNTNEYKALKQNINLINNAEYVSWLKDNNLEHINFNKLIKNKEWLSGHILSEKYEGFTDISGVSTHPHNFYLQLISETGILGTVCISFLWILSLIKILSKLDNYYKFILMGLCINLFPFILNGNFFSGWLSILLFYPLGFLMKQYKEK
jgi:hypothetical protein